MTYADSIRPSVGRGVPSAEVAEAAENRKRRALLRRVTLQLRASRARTRQERAAEADTPEAHRVAALSPSQPGGG